MKQKLDKQQYMYVIGIGKHISFLLAERMKLTVIALLFVAVAQTKSG